MATTPTSVTDTTAPTTGVDFVSLQVSDMDKSRTFYCDTLGLPAAPTSPPGAQLIATRPVFMALRTDITPEPGTAGRGVTLWIAVDDVDTLHKAVTASGAKAEGEPVDGPFGRMFTVTDPDGYRLTLHNTAG
ncbi:glyoxalase [Streptomyces longisporoflavus]|uniref:VOC family protein n=1 Tax=Streptomyces longisporoflavus TaxID=28044 RepID=UPI00167D2326|nr:VOC family protein [Streptomyces longisporoflavus]GGV67183.1 glyoxalase [Streptomyces longisporoflavus]